MASFAILTASAQANVPLSQVTAIAMGFMHSCAITVGGGVK